MLPRCHSLRRFCHQVSSLGKSPVKPEDNAGVMYFKGKKGEKSSGELWLYENNRGNWLEEQENLCRDKTDDKISYDSKLKVSNLQI